MSSWPWKKPCGAWTGSSASPASRTRGVATITAEIRNGTDRDQALSDIRSAVDRVRSLPADAEEPDVRLLNSRSQVVSLVVYGDLNQHELRALTERARDDLLASPEITTVEVDGIPPVEVSVEVPQDVLREHDLTLDQIAQTIGAMSVELPGGGVETPGGERVIRTDARRETGDEFGEIEIVSNRTGSVLTLDDLGTVIDGFADTDESAFFNGYPAARVLVYRVGDETPITVSDAVQDYLVDFELMLPDGAYVSIWDDDSEIYRARIDLLMRNAKLGLLLVLLVLGIFLEVRLAFWVTMGIPISFLGAMLLMPVMDVSINMISLFAFILTLGIVVDDAIVVGEAVFAYRQKGHSAWKAAVMGAREVAAPVVFSVTTTVIAFMPMFFLPGGMGKFFRVIPAVVVAVLLLSLVESLLILPAHLSHLHNDGIFGRVARAQERFANFVDRSVERIFGPIVRFTTTMRWATFAFSVAILMITMGYVRSGKLSFTFMPRIESDVVYVSASLPYGSPIEITEEVQERILRGVEATFEELGGADVFGRGVYASVGSTEVDGGPSGSGEISGSHLTQVSAYLVPAGDRPFTTAEFTQRWREHVGEIAGLERLTFQFNIGPSGGSAIDVELSHNSVAVLEEAANDVAATLAEFPGVREIDNGFSAGKEQLNLTLLPAGRALGLTELDVARQVRGAFFGVEAVRQQRGRDELRVYVRLPQAERVSEQNIEDLVIRTPLGGEVPLRDAVAIERGTTYTSIERVNGRRVIHVTADVDEDVVTSNEIVDALQGDDEDPGPLRELSSRYSGLEFGFAGEQRDQAETMAGLRVGLLGALAAMFGLMAVWFRSYIQPVIVMLAIPFGFVGSIVGHVVMGYNLSMLSMMGMVALAGVVVNDSLVLITAINDFKDGGMTTREAATQGALRRFRPILLTSLTTFFGLAPMIAETSVQARFLIPMAISLGFGVLFVTFVTLVLVPALYTMVDDVRWFFSHSVLSVFVKFDRSEGEPAATEEPPDVAWPVSTRDG